MSVSEIQALVERIRTWPADKQQLALDLLRWIEAKDLEDDFALSPEEQAELDEALAEADRGEFVPEEEMKTFFDKYR